MDQADRLSLSVWIEPDDTPGDDEYILYRHNNYYLKINSSRKIVGGLNDATERITSATAITCDGAVWTHIEMTYDKDAGGTDEIKLYINGVLDATADYSTAISASDKKLYIGAGDTAGDNTPENWFDGQIDSVQLYQYARSADNVRLDYNEGLATHLGPSSKTCSEDPASCMDYGLVGYWNMDEGTGTTAYDGSDNSNDGTLTNGPKWTTDSPPLQGGAGGGSSLQFDGDDDYVDCGDLAGTCISDPSVSGALTVELWAYIKGGDYIISSGAQSSSRGFMMSYDDGNTRYVWLHDGTNKWELSGVSMPLNEWHHYLFTWDSSVLTYYVDGVVSATDDTPVGAVESDDNTKLTIASPNSLIGQYTLNGSIDSVRIYNRALSAEEIRYHYNRGGPVAEWNFDEGSGQTAYDESFNNNDGTLGATSAVEASDPTWVEGKYGGALSFDGTDDYVDCGSNASLKTDTNKWSLEMWVYPEVTPFEGFFTFETTAGKWLSTIQISYWSTRIAVGGIRDDMSLPSLTLNEWTHLTFVYDGISDIKKIYKNGIVSEKHPTSHGAGSLALGSADTINIGRHTDLLAYFNGSIDDVRIYNYARTPEQILQDYNRGKGVYFK